LVVRVNVLQNVLFEEQRKVAGTLQLELGVIHQNNDFFVLLDALKSVLEHVLHEWRLDGFFLLFESLVLMVERVQHLIFFVFNFFNREIQVVIQFVSLVDGVKFGDFSHVHRIQLDS